MDDTDYMRFIAIEESTKGDWPYGSVIVKEGAILVKGLIRRRAIAIRQRMPRST